MSDSPEEGNNKASLRRSLRLSVRSPLPVKTLKRRMSSEETLPQTRSKRLSFNEDTASLPEEIATTHIESDFSGEDISSSRKEAPGIQLESNCVVVLTSIQEENIDIESESCIEPKDRNNCSSESTETKSMGHKEKTFTKGNCVVLLTPIEEVNEGSNSETEVNQVRVNSSVSEKEKISQQENIQSKENISPNIKQPSEEVSACDNPHPVQKNVPLDVVECVEETLEEPSDHPQNQNVDGRTNSRASEYLVVEVDEINSCESAAAVGNELINCETGENGKDEIVDTTAVADSVAGLEVNKDAKGTEHVNLAPKGNEVMDSASSIVAACEILGEKQIDDDEQTGRGIEKTQEIVHIIESTFNNSSDNKVLEVEEGKKCNSEIKTFVPEEKLGNDICKSDNLGEIENVNNKPNYKKPVISSTTDEKISRLVSKEFNSDSENEMETNSFINFMAEEGEEDTPSEGSNDIIDVGEEINTTESEFSTDESFADDSFIDDDESHPLLSGEEYDLSLEDRKEKKTRIIDVSKNTDKVIVLNKPKKEEKKRKSRIIRPVDSSDEENHMTTEDHHKQTMTSVELVDNNISVAIEEKFIEKGSSEPLINSHEKSINCQKSMESKSNLETVNAGSILEQKNLSSSTGYRVKHSPNKITVHEDIILPNSSTGSNKAITAATNTIPVAKQQFESNVAIFQNVKLQDISKDEFSKRINEVMDSLCSKIMDISNASINLNLTVKDAVFQKITSEKRKRNNTVEDSSRTLNERNELNRPSKKSSKEFVSKKKTNLNEKPDTVTHFSLHPKIRNEMFNVTTKQKKINPVLAPNNQKRLHSDVFTTEQNEQQGAKKRKINRRKSEINPTIRAEPTQMNLLDEALHFRKEKEVNTLLPSTSSDGWKVKNSGMTPSKANEAVKKKFSKSDGQAFQVKDFKNSMLFDYSRIPRKNIDQMVKKRP